MTRRSLKRRGYSLVMVALCLTSLMGILGLVLDAGLLFIAHRASQNAADAAARACAEALHAGTAATLQSIAETFVFTHNDIPRDEGSTTQVEVFNPPSSGPYSSDSHYVEVFVRYPLATTFIQATGVAQDQSVRTRAVAGFKQRDVNAGLVVLNPRGNPGISVGGTPATLDVDSGIVVYSRRAGQDEYGNTVGEYTNGQAAVTVGGSATFQAEAMYVSGGVDDYLNYTAPDVGELHAGTNDPVFDPFHDGSSQLPIPTTTNGVINRNLGSPNIRNNNRTGIVAPNSHNAQTGVTTLHPGVYRGISITGGTVNFRPGIYVLSPSSGGNVFSITGGTVTGTSVMFYNTGNDYNATNGSPDSGDLSALSETDPPNLNGTQFGGISIQGNYATFSGIDPTNADFTTPSSPEFLNGADITPFKDLLFYQRRFNTSTINISNGQNDGMQGVLYAKWANLQLTGSGTYDFAIVVGAMSVSGGATVNIQASLATKPKIEPVRLVE